MTVNERAEKLSERKKKSLGRAWTQFQNGYQRNDEALYCFYEGKDDQLYYNHRVRSIVFDSSDGEIRSIWCGGKENVLSLLALLDSKSKYQGSWAAFFVDRDYDPEPEQSQRLYVTLNHSFENFYATPNALSQILADEFHIPPDDEEDEHQSTLALYEQQLTQFNTAMLEIHVWIYCQRQKACGESSEGKLKRRLNLGDVSTSDLLMVGLKQTQVRLSLEDFVGNFEQPYSITDNEWQVVSSKFRTMDLFSVARGKYLIYFWDKFLRRLVDDRRAKDDRRAHFKHRGKVALNLSENILSELTQYADTPQCLRRFLLDLKKTEH